MPNVEETSLPVRGSDSHDSPVGDESPTRALKNIVTLRVKKILIKLFKM
jgi:hypothetical protein